MSTAPNDGGPAFAGLEGIPGYGNSLPMKCPSGEFEWVTLNQGMSLRDWFAGMVLQGRMANSFIVQNMEQTGVPSKDAPAAIAAWSYQQADAMLAEREKKR